LRVWGEWKERGRERGRTNPHLLPCWGRICRCWKMQGTWKAEGNVKLSSIGQWV